MQRDMDLVRDLLLQISAADQPLTFPNFLGDDVSQQQLRLVAYHLKMLIEEAGLISAIDAKSHSGPAWLRMELTWKGNDFLDQIRDPEIWRRTKAGAAKAGGFSIELLSALAKGLIKKQIEKHTGIELEL